MNTEGCDLSRAQSDVVPDRAAPTMKRLGVIPIEDHP
jgi:hypothetical protein